MKRGKEKGENVREKEKRKGERKGENGSKRVKNEKREELRENGHNRSKKYDVARGFEKGMGINVDFELKYRPLLKVNIYKNLEKVVVLLSNTKYINW